MKKLIFVSLINYMNKLFRIGSKKLEKTWVGKNDYAALTLEESEYKNNKMDDVFVEYLGSNLKSAELMLDNGYVIPTKIKKALLNNVVLGMFNFKSESYPVVKNIENIENLIRDIERGSQYERNSDLTEFYIKNNLIDEMFIKHFIIKKENKNKDGEKIFSTYIDIYDGSGSSYGFKKREYVQLIIQAIDKRLLDPVSIIKDYKKVNFEAVVIMIVMYKNELTPLITDDLKKELDKFFLKLKNNMDYQKRANQILKDIFKEKPLIKEIEYVLNRINKTRLNSVIEELKEDSLNIAIKESNFKTIAKEFNSREVDQLIEKYDELIKKISTQDLNSEQSHNKAILQNKIGEILLNNLSLKELQIHDYSTDDLKNGLEICINQFIEIYEDIVNTSLLSLKSDLKLRKLKVN